MNVKKLSIIILVLLAIPLVNSADQLNLKSGTHMNFIRFYQDNFSQTNMISYEVLHNNSMMHKILNFQLEMNYKNNSQTLCRYNVNLSQYNKITCIVPELGSGKYSFTATLMDGAQVIDALRNNIEIKPIILKDPNSNSTISFEHLGNDTRVTIDVNQKGSNLVVENTIPKTVIKHLDVNNEKTLISSNQSFQILNSDPLIAWNINNGPTKIHYTIHKNINDSQMHQFALSVKQGGGFRILEYIIFALIALIIILVFRPAFKKNPKKN